MDWHRDMHQPAHQSDTMCIWGKLIMLPLICSANCKADTLQDKHNCLYCSKPSECALQHGYRHGYGCDYTHAHVPNRTFAPKHLLTSDMLAKPMVLDCGTAGMLLERMAPTMALTAESSSGVYRNVRQSPPCCNNQKLGMVAFKTEQNN